MILFIMLFIFFFQDLHEFTKIEDIQSNDLAYLQDFSKIEDIQSNDLASIHEFTEKKIQIRVPTLQSMLID